ncbi:hypothetical protein BRYFOR_05412 [Marvinbryantia formatexigens DSM 14469]|uniref:Transcription regulator BetR N-terminal domain-containing protein n=1 Tax=Marvinbryantia formatexigens DSM 14469 TaxID=478749 RepID=C6L9X0_9FIRM|nr:helix-turn-helix domain-containing protein [Marvinbryantia formatexigens]EET62377.1 hypothetical protein BRYFOR_05412 [Marvinbryantia formatexigens DSM 14469]UWO25075.1 helix-turn-helix domain-containing protein [Marvinbryantia formatexigens DSM 14469]SDG94339.1 BetR domain-containing protein [Marvinbryantia formatexigens]
MARTQTNIFPMLRVKMAFFNINTSELAEILQMSEDSTRRRLRGEVQFELSEIVKLMKFFSCTFEELFGDTTTTGKQISNFY